ncbi:MAG: alpha/beta hydrolase [Candidatus Thorarchaeota archaeon]
MSVHYLEGAEPLFIKGSNTGYLLLHGAGGGTTWDLKEFAYLINSRTGATVLLPTLKGFGTRPEDLYNVSFSDWMTDAREGFKKIHRFCDTIFVVGHSMGGTLTLILASEQTEIAAITTWAAALGIKNRQLFFLPIISKIPFIKGIVPKKYVNPAAMKLKEKGWIGYDWIPTILGLTILEGLRRVKQSLNDVTCPAFIIQGTSDESVSDNSAKRIYDCIKSSKKELWYVKGAPHPLMTDESFKDELFSRTIAFLEGSK